MAVALVAALGNSRNPATPPAADGVDRAHATVRRASPLAPARPGCCRPRPRAAEPSRRSWRPRPPSRRAIAFDIDEGGASWPRAPAPDRGRRRRIANAPSPSRARSCRAGRRAPARCCRGIAVESGRRPARYSTGWPGLPLLQQGAPVILIARWIAPENPAPAQAAAVALTDGRFVSLPVERPKRVHHIIETDRLRAVGGLPQPEPIRPHMHRMPRTPGSPVSHSRSDRDRSRHRQDAQRLAPDAAVHRDQRRPQPSRRSRHLPVGFFKRSSICRSSFPFRRWLSAMDTKPPARLPVMAVYDAART